MIGVGQANRLMEFIAVIRQCGARELPDKRTGGARVFSNPFNVNGDGAAYIYLTRKGDIRFGPTLTRASMMSEAQVTNIISGKTRPRAAEAPQQET